MKSGISRLLTLAFCENHQSHIIEMILERGAGEKFLNTVKKKEID